MKTQETGLPIYVISIFSAAITLVLFVGYGHAVRSNSAPQYTLLMFFAIALFSLTMTIQAVIVRWGSRANDILQSLQKVESLISISIIHAKQNQCDGCQKVFKPTELTILNIGKIVCSKCKETIEAQYGHRDM
jgi:hypothetical protein